MALEKLKRKRKKKRGATDLARESRYLPNILTMGRIVMIPAILLFIDNYSPVRSFVACLIYLAASLTDSLDGWLARRRKQVSVLGKFLDPLADKLMVTAVLVYLTAMDRVPPWLVVALLARELAVTGLRSIAVSEGLVLSASDQGKQKTALQMVGTMFLLIHFRYRVWGLESFTIRDEPLVINFHAVGMVTLYLALAMSVLSALDYFRVFVRAVGERNKQLAPPPSPSPSPSSDAPKDPASAEPPK
ncbi:MAG TPA: CDP-diacylglycerol--glycerol-3-phosphate 3-phosphatidyltransferase [Polyangia bacterium]|nr:CDP-diacylglycerol--glycerol-3-phosphate 3-phosphatidyltransferase [Polyangia bacterium]